MGQTYTICWHLQFKHVSRPVNHALHKLMYLRFNCCTASNTYWKPWERQLFWNWNNLAILKGEFTFDLMGHNFTAIRNQPVKMNLELPHICMVKILLFQNGTNSHLVAAELCVICTLTMVPNTCWDSAFQLLPHEVKMQNLHIRSHVEYFLVLENSWSDE